MPYADELLPPSEYYKKFIEAERVKLSFFEKLCKASHKILKISAPESVKKKLGDPIFLSGMKTTPDEVYSLTLLSLLLSLLIFLPISFLDFPSTIIFLIFPPFIAYNVFTYPIFHSEVIRIRAGNEIISIILYMVTYLSLNPVYERAIEFAASRSHGPVGNDFKKVVWDVESGRFSTIREALATYSRKWTLWNEEFVNSLLTLRLIETQPTVEGRNEILKNVTERIMVSASSKMEDYASALKTPSTLLMLFGITLPLISLVMFPIISIFLTKTVNPIYIGIGYTVILPFFLWWFLYRMISKRPATYSHSEKLEEVAPERYIKLGRLRIPIIPVALLLGFIIAIPGLLYYLELYSYNQFIFSRYPYQQAMQKWGEYCLSRYEPSFMLMDTFKAIFVVWGIAFSIIFLTYFRSKRPYKLELFIEKLEDDFVGGLFELQSALRQNIPMETAILKLIEQYRRLGKEKSTIAIFFSDLYRKLVREGTPVREALFGKGGLIVKLPSSLIKNTMGIVTSALSKGSLIASDVTRNIVSYLTRLKEIERMVKRSMKDILSNLTMQGKFIAPFIAGIVASSAVIMIQLLQAVANAIKAIERMYNFGTNVGGSMSGMLSLINFEEIMPPTVMELIGGIYLIEVIIIIAIFITGIEKGFNKVHRDYMISRFLTVGVILFTVVFFIMVLAFQPIISQIR